MSREAGHATVSVTDDGPDVSEAIGERVFGRVVRGSPGSDGGCGLGLAIVREVARQHGGDCLLERRERGASFVIRLPCDGP